MTRIFNCVASLGMRRLLLCCVLALQAFIAETIALPMPSAQASHTICNAEFHSPRVILNGTVLRSYGIGDTQFCQLRHRHGAWL